jgi:hypothetical protein
MTMEDLDKELGSVVDEFVKKKGEIRDNNERERQKRIAKIVDFKDLFKNVVEPIIVEYVKYLNEKKNQNSRMTRDPHFAEVAFTIGSDQLSPHNHTASIKFKKDENRIKIEEQIDKDAWTENCERNQLTPEFVRTKLSNLIKTYFNPAYLK